MENEFLRQVAANFEQAVKQQDRTGLVNAARTLIEGRAELGDQWLQIAIQLIRWAEIDLASSALDLWGQQGAPEGEALFEQAVLYARVGRHEEAESFLGKIADDQPTAFANAHLKGSIATNAGDTDRAEVEFRRALKAAPNFARAWLSIVQLGRATDKDETEIRRLASSGAKIDRVDRASLHSALGTLAHGRKDYAEAFEQFKKTTNILGERFTYQGEDNLESANIVKRWSASDISELSNLEPTSGRAPIFVTGLARSGTTLVEQILSAHSSVDGGTELGLAVQLEATADGFAPDDIRSYLAKGGTHAELRDLYLRLAAERIPGDGMFVDKSLNQSRSIGPYAVLFPDAPIIWMRRDPLDNAWSMYRSWLANNVTGGWSLENIAHHMRIEDDLLRHWKSVLGDRVLEVPYAELVEDPETWIDRINAHCGLETEPMQLTPHLSDRAVTTASAQQVRQPINKRGLGVSDPYRQWLAPFEKAYARSDDRSSTTAASAEALPSMAPVADTEDLKLEPVDLLRKLKQAMAARERAGVNNLIAALVAKKAKLGEQWRGLAQVTSHNGELSLMRDVLDRWEADVGRSPTVLVERARLEAMAGDPQRAWDLVEMIDETTTDPLALNYLKGTLSTSLGKLENSRHYLRRAIEVSPASGQSWMALIMSGKAEAEDGEKLIEAAPHIAKAPLLEQAPYHFALGRWLEKREKYEEAFAALKRGGELMMQERVYRPEIDKEEADAALAYDRAFIDRMTEKMPDVDQGRPIFVTGLPRSGTTLVEQTLVAHSAVDNGSEIGLMRAVGQEAGGLQRQALEKFVESGRSLGELRALHDHLLDERFPSNGMVVDKTLNLPRTLGAVSILYPKAPIVWMRRDPADCAWSAFRTFFIRSVDWAWRLEDIANHFNLEDQLFQHWSEVLKDRILVVPYPELVADPETWITRITEHCGLEVEPGQFESHKVERTVATASAAQVREPINRKGIGTAAPYRELMKPFFDAYKGDA